MPRTAARWAGRWATGTTAVVGAFALMSWSAVMAAAPASAAPAQQAITFTSSGSWSVPDGVVCASFDVFGARGGDGGTFGDGAGGAGGLGGEVFAHVPVVPGGTYTLGVGQRGGDGSGVSGAGSAGVYAQGVTAQEAGTGGAIGGGPGGDGLGAGGGGGGGLSSVSIGSSPVVVAGGGGGGGAGFDPSLPGAAGGVDEAAGADAGGEPNATGGGGASNSAAGTAGANSFGDTEPTAGATGGTDGGTGGSSGDGGGGGGGGYFGGGGGGAGYESGGAGGGGGSDFIAIPSSSNISHGVDAGNGGNGKIIVTFTPGDTTCYDAPLTIKKVTTGATPVAGASFTVHVQCANGNIDNRIDPNASGSSRDFVFTVDAGGVVQPSSGYVIGFESPDQCTVTETDSGNATSVSYDCTSGTQVLPESVGAQSWAGAAAVEPSGPVCPASVPSASPVTVEIIRPDQTAAVTVTNDIEVVAAAVTVTPKFTG